MFLRVKQSLLFTSGKKSLLINFIIRGLNLFSKFFLTLFLAKYSDSSFLGSYSIFITTITISIYFLGFEFYAYSQREYLSNQQEKLPSYLKNQVIVHFFSYLLLTPLICYFSYSFIPNGNLLFFIIIMLFEHFNQELYRLLVVLKKPTQANISYFFRSGIWIFSFIFLSYLKSDLRTLEFIFLNWLIGEVICLIFSLYILRELNFLNVIKEKIEWGWIVKGLKVSSVFFISGFILKLIEYSERYFIKSIIGEKILGVYFFFYNIAYIPYIFFTSILVISYLPKIVVAYNANDEVVYKSEQKAFYKSTNMFLLLCTPLTVVFFLFFTNYYITDLYILDNKNIFWGLLIASSVTIYAEIQYLELYIRHLDKQILYSFIFAEIICLLANYFLIHQFGIGGAVISKIIVALSLFFARMLIVNKYYARTQP